MEGTDPVKDPNKVKQALDLLLTADPGLARKNLHVERYPNTDGPNWAVRDQEGRTYKIGPLVTICCWIAE